MTLNNENVTVRTLTVLKHLGITTFKELQSAVLPSIGQMVYYNFLLNIDIRYSQRVANEINELLNK